MGFSVKYTYSNDEYSHTVYSFDEIRDNCIYLDCSYHSLTSLKGIEKLIQLQTLNCSNNNLTSLEGIENLTKLKVFNCSHNNLTSLKGIENLTQLRQLECYNNKLTSLEFIRNLSSLQILDCAFNYLKDLKDIENLTKLEIIYCYNNKITSLEHVRNLLQLQKLDCTYNQLKSLKGIETLTQLEVIACNYNQLTTLEGLENLTQLQSIYCYYNQITSLPLSLMNFRNLRFIKFYNNPIDNIPLQLLRFINRIRQNNIKKVNVYNDNQNVHDSAIQLSVFDSINRLTEHITTPFNLEELTTDIINDTILNCKERLLEYIENKEIHSLLLLNFSEILWLVWNVIKEFPEETQNEIKKRLNEEIQEAECMCYTGGCNRLINCLNGFSDLVEIKIQDASQIGNVIVVVKERLEDEEQYSVEEHKKEVKKELLERGYELHVINEWIEYIE